MPTLTREFKVGDRVAYIPSHAHGNAAHPDVERGTVTSINDAFVFVCFPPRSHSQACSPHSLQIED